MTENNSDKNKDKKPSEVDVDAKARMLEALAKKQNKNNTGVKGGPSSGSKVAGATGANAPKMFRRKSGPSGSAG
jgi:hypothetical protein